MKYIIYSICTIFFISCNDGKKKSEQVFKKPQSSQIKKHEKPSKVQAKYQPEIEEWQEYEDLSVFLHQYTSISPNDALNNSRELNEISKRVVDSLKPAIFETPAFNARVNLLYNETLRLFDMSSIPAIKANEVNNHVDKILTAFSSINSKINTTLKQLELELTVEDISFKKRFQKRTQILSLTLKNLLLNQKRRPYQMET